MSTASPAPVDVVGRFLKAMEAKDFDAAMPLIGEACVYTNVPLATVQGPAAVRAVLEPFFAPTLSNELIVKHQVADGRVVVVERLDRHQLADRWVELPVTGVMEVDDGKITAWRDYFDVATLTSQWPELQAQLG